ncbi:response regulator [Chromatiaceae bacterium AAb-1]|nr:response regulator [Chromatiaceae bacterium AAb-1]
MTLSDCTILIIDDAYTIREYLRHTLQQLEIHHIQEAATGEQGIALFKAQRHDVIFLDIELPDANGQALLKQIKEIEEAAHVVMITAHNTVENVQQSIMAGASGFVAKPFSPQKIKNIIERCMAAKLS